MGCSCCHPNVGKLRGRPCDRAAGAAGAAGTGEDILHVGQNKACQVQEISDHLALDADVQGRIGVEAAGVECKTGSKQHSRRILGPTSK